MAASSPHISEEKANVPGFPPTTPGLNFFLSCSMKSEWSGRHPITQFGPSIINFLHECLRCLQKFSVRMLFNILILEWSYEMLVCLKSQIKFRMTVMKNMGKDFRIGLIPRVSVKAS